MITAKEKNGPAETEMGARRPGARKVPAEVEEDSPPELPGGTSPANTLILAP